MAFMVCLSSTKINPQQLAYFARSFYVPFHTTHVMALLSKSIATTSEMSKTELVLCPDHYFWVLLHVSKAE